MASISPRRTACSCCPKCRCRSAAGAQVVVYRRIHRPTPRPRRCCSCLESSPRTVCCLASVGMSPRRTAGTRKQPCRSRTCPSGIFCTRPGQRSFRGRMVGNSSGRRSFRGRMFGNSSGPRRRSSCRMDTGGIDGRTQTYRVGTPI
jgi:hypothetical protein